MNKFLLKFKQKDSFNLKLKLKNSLPVLKIVLLMLPLLLLILLFTIIPIFHTFIKSLRFTPNEANRTIYEYNFKNYNNILSDPNFQHAILNSTFVLLFGTGISIILALIFSFIINSLISRTTKSILLSVIYSQFFISGFAIGIAFTNFFGSKNLFFYILGLSQYSFTSGNKRLPIWIYYAIYQIWRSLPFNLILFAAALSRSDYKYKKLMLNDKLTLLQSFRYVYLNELSKVLFSILFTNFIFACLLLPSALLEDSFNVDLNYAHTLTSYTIKYFGWGSSGVLRFEKGYSAAFFSFSYLVLLLCVILLLRPKTIKSIYKLIKKVILKHRGKYENKNNN
ncbi:sugar ABC transporter permease [Mycoplasma mycoides subsp. capri]|uniref:sugar ABC transporter permease n=1 Tax=Mycoplasma mycoides TaxID=2102 RepID=UPI00223F3510|nr:sugar ABC transporter permease [Mycoplasma mycoides]UZK63834.1 sugar ABC transporter permease [Mycoplasma mycoides subsp. capri]